MKKTIQYVSICFFSIMALSACGSFNKQDSSMATVGYQDSVPENINAKEMLSEKIQKLESSYIQLQEDVDYLKKQYERLGQSIAVLASSISEDKPQRQTNSANRLDQAKRAFAMKQYVTVIHLLSENSALNQTSDDTKEALWLLIKSHYALKHCESVATLTQRLSAQYVEYDKTPHAWLLVAQCQIQLQQRDIARATLLKMINQYPNSSAVKQAEQLLKK